MNKPQHFTSHDHRWLYKPEKPKKPRYHPEKVERLILLINVFAAGFLVALLVMGI